MPDDIHPLPVGTILRAADGSDQYKVILDYHHDGVGYSYTHSELGDELRQCRKKDFYCDTDFDELLEGKHHLKQYEIAFRPDE